MPAQPHQTDKSISLVQCLGKTVFALQIVKRHLVIINQINSGIKTVIKNMEESIMYSIACGN